MFRGVLGVDDHTLSVDMVADIVINVILDDPNKLGQPYVMGLSQDQRHFLMSERAEKIWDSVTYPKD